MDLLSKYEESKHSVGKGMQEYGEEQQYNPETPKIIRYVMRYSGGYIENEKQASYAILGFVALAIIVSLFLLFGGSNKNNLPPKIMDDTFDQTSGMIQN